MSFEFVCVLHWDGEVLDGDSTRDFLYDFSVLQFNGDRTLFNWGFGFGLGSMNKLFVCVSRSGSVLVGTADVSGIFRAGSFGETDALSS